MQSLISVASLVLPFLLVGSGLSQSQENRPFEFTSRPKANYTERARKKEIEGVVMLHVTLLDTGEVGSITDVTKKDQKRLARYGLIDEAIKAAKQITFKPKVVNGKPVSVRITLAYAFSVY